MICSLGAPPKSVSGAEVLVSFFFCISKINVCQRTFFKMTMMAVSLPQTNSCEADGVG